MKVQRARFRIIAMLVLCAFALVMVFSFRTMNGLPEPAAEAGDLPADAEYDEQAQITAPPESLPEDAVPVESVPPAEPLDTFGL